jgi:hypothetical protein
MRSDGDETTYVAQLDIDRVEKEWQAILGLSTCSCIDTAS